jgi:CubicO group peptidase (beta-lactamase class C family)
MREERTHVSAEPPELTPEQRAGAGIFLGGHSSWAFGMGVCIAREKIYQTPGRYGWDGGFGTPAYIDPAEGRWSRFADAPRQPCVWIGS